MQEAWVLYPEPWLTPGMQGSTAEPHLWAPSDGQVMEMQVNMDLLVWWRGTTLLGEQVLRPLRGTGGWCSPGSSEEVQGGFSAADKDMLRIVKGIGEDLP